MCQLRFATGGSGLWAGWPIVGDAVLRPLVVRTGGSAIEIWGFMGMAVVFTGYALLSVLLLALPSEAEGLEPTAAA